MDQNQAINLLDNLIAQQALPRTQHENAKIAIQLLRSMAKEFTAMVLEKRANEAKVAAVVKNPDAPKPPVDIIDKSTA